MKKRIYAAKAREVLPLTKRLIRSRYDDKEHLTLGIEFDPEEKLTKDSFADECDINIIVDRYMKTGLLPNSNRGQPIFGDFAEVPDYQDALMKVRNAETVFYGLPASVREDCGNDPAVFLDRVNDPAFLQKHGLLVNPSPAAPEAPQAPQDAPKEDK